MASKELFFATVSQPLQNTALQRIFPAVTAARLFQAFRDELLNDDDEVIRIVYRSRCVTVAGQDLPLVLDGGESLHKVGLVLRQGLVFVEVRFDLFIRSR